MEWDGRGVGSLESALPMQADFVAVEQHYQHITQNITWCALHVGSLCVLPLPSLAPEERMLWERSTCRHGMCWMYTN